MEAEDLEKVVHAVAEETRKTMMLELEAVIKRLVAEKLKEHEESSFHA